MVNHGRSGGCVTCKERRVKCDEARPNCQACQQLQLQCGGYKTKYANFKFKVQTPKFRAQSAIVRRATPQTQTRAYNLLPLSAPDTAVTFYLHHYARMGRDMTSARGFYEVLIPIYCSQRQDSALSLAVSAVASQVMSLWRHDNSSLPQETYTQAVKRLRHTLQDRREWGNAATMLAVLALQLFESIVAIYGLRPSTQIHHNGAVSFLPFASAGDHNEGASVYVRQFILHTEVCSAIRQGRPLQPIVSASIGGDGLFTLPENPSAALDAIGVSVAKLQARHLKLGLQREHVMLSPEVLSECMAKTRRIDLQLLTWAQCVPDHWQPLEVTNIDPSVPLYQSTCEIYPSCQIATIWNLWRLQRILVVNIKLSLLHATPNTCPSDPEGIGKSSNLQEVTKLQHILQELVDGVCYSVPFYLGNLSKSLSMTDFADPTILLPSLHYCSGHDGDWNKAAVDDHRRHIIAQGPWHVMSPLSRLLTLCFEEGVPPMRSLLRPGQYEWIRDQFLRVTTLLHIPPVISSVEDGPSSSDAMAENLVAGVRKGAVFMSGA